MTAKIEKPMPPVDQASLRDLTESAAQNARATTYPGATNGPADAYRHMLGIAEFRRRTNHPAARVAGDWNEKEGSTLRPDTWRLKTDADSQMDLHNNRIGERIGRVARNTAEVEAMAHAEVRAAAIEGGTGANGTAVYLPPEKWTDPGKRDERTVWPPHDLAGSSEVERILGKPTRLWTADDARKVMQDRIYTQSTHPRQAEAFEKVRKHFEYRYPAPTRGRAVTQSSSGGGPVHVDAYTRSDGTKVSTHSRSAPGPR
jgi:hypothetical protein